MGWIKKAAKSVSKGVKKVTERVVDTFTTPSSYYMGPIGLAYNLATGRDVAEDSVDLYNDITGRTDAEEKAKAEKDAAEYQRDTILGEMERELAIKKQEAGDWVDEVRLQSAQAEGRIEQSYGENVQNAYITQLNSENALLKEKVENQRSIGGLTSQIGSSGVRNSGSVELLVATEQAADAAEEGLSRKGIDSGMRAMVSGSQASRREGIDKVGQVRTKADSTMAQFDPGSAYMDLYNFKRERVTGSTAMQTAYLDSAIDSTYDWTGYLGDAIRIGSGAFMGFQAGGPVGAAFGGASALFA